MIEIDDKYFKEMRVYIDSKYRKQIPFCDLKGYQSNCLGCGEGSSDRSQAGLFKAETSNTTSILHSKEGEERLTLSGRRNQRREGSAEVSLPDV